MLLLPFVHFGPFFHENSNDKVYGFSMEEDFVGKMLFLHELFKCGNLTANIFFTKRCRVDGKYENGCLQFLDILV